MGRGILIENSFAIGYSKRIPVKKLEIMPALQITALQRRLDINALNFGDYIDARWNERFLDFTGGNLPATRKNVVDINFGALVKLSQAFVVGFTAKHITQPDVGLNGFAQMPAKYVVHASYDKVINENSLISVLAWLTEQGGTEEAKLQTSVVLKKHLYTGLGAGVSNNYSSGLVNLGYRGNYWSVSVFLGTQYYPETKSFWNSSQLSISANIRDKEHRRTLTALYSW